MIEISNVDAYYGQTQALFAVNLRLPERGCIGLLGRNGAGKTSLLRAIAGADIRSTGEMRLNDLSMAGWAAEERARRGIGYVPQEGDVFVNLSVEENLRMGEAGRLAGESAFRRDDIYKLFPRLKERLRSRAGSLSGGERKMLAMSRALLMNPSVLLLDEPTEGVWHEVVNDLARAIRECTERMLIVLAEQNLEFVFAASSRCVVLERGMLVADDYALRMRTAPDLSRWLAV